MSGSRTSRSSANFTMSVWMLARHSARRRSASLAAQRAPQAFHVARRRWPSDCCHVSGRRCASHRLNYRSLDRRSTTARRSAWPIAHRPKVVDATSRQGRAHRSRASRSAKSAPARLFACRTGHDRACTRINTPSARCLHALALDRWLAPIALLVFSACADTAAQQGPPPPPRSPSRRHRARRHRMG